MMMTELLTKAFEIYLIPADHRLTVGDVEDVRPEALEGLPLDDEGKVIGYYRDVHKIQFFVASLEPSAPIPEELRRKLEAKGSTRAWIGWPFPDDKWHRRAQKGNGSGDVEK